MKKGTNNYAMEKQATLFYYTLDDLRSMKKGKKVTINHKGFDRTFTILEEHEHCMILQNQFGQIHKIVYRENPKWSAETRRRKMGETICDKY